MKSTVERLKSVLSYTEIQSIKLIVAEVGDENEVIITASKVAEKAKITKSVVVNAMKLLQVAGVIESRSLGVKGTYIHVLDKKALEEVAAAF